jgi:hypothetical protein
VAKNAVLVAVIVDLATNAISVEHMRRVAVQTAYVTATPDTLKANSTVIELSLFEEESTVGPSADLYSDPSELSRIPLNVAESE